MNIDAEDFAFCFIEAMEQDADELVIATEVVALMKLLDGQQELFMEVGEIMGSRYKNALIDYREIYLCSQKIMRKERCFFCATLALKSEKREATWCIAKAISGESSHCR